MKKEEKTDFVFLPDKQQETDSQLLIEIPVLVSILWTVQPPKKVAYSEYKWEKKRQINLLFIFLKAKSTNLSRVHGYHHTRNF